jgi:oxygen-independent coproporphyrinogen-3 oxidase
MVHYLYIHIPFCIAKCDYCDFYSIPLCRDGSGQSWKYVYALLKEMDLRRDIAGNLRTVYLGGGTPTLLSSEQVAAILTGVRETFSIVSGAEITIEANPGTVSEKQFGALRENGINRVSIGMQSLSGRELCTLGRSHTVEDSFAAVCAARKAGFDNISLDLIYGIPGQHMDIWKNTMSRALELFPEHVSAYELTPEESTPLHAKLARGVYALPDESLVIEMYYAALEKMKDHGYLHYEISNFAKRGYESVHNLNYWNRGEYLGVGAGAHSFFKGKRTSNIPDLYRYMESINSSVMPVDEEIAVTEQDEFNEMIFLGLRKTEGIDMRLMTDKERLLNNKAVDALRCHGLIEIEDSYLRLTGKGLVMSTEIMVQILRDT